MKFTVKKEIISDALSKIRNVLGAKSTIPVLAGVKVEVLKDCILLTASDATESIVHRILADDGSVVIEAEGAAVFTKDSLEVATKLSGDITYELIAGNLSVTQGKKTALHFTTMLAEDYPAISTAGNNQPILLSGKQFSDLISNTVYAVSKSDARPVLTGVNLTIGQELQAVSTDSHRLARVNIPLATPVEEIMVTIPGKMLDHALKAFDLSNQVILSVDHSQVAMANGNTVYYSRLIEGNYPETARLIPVDFKSHLIIDTKEIIESLQLLSSLSKEGVVKMEIDGMFVKLDSKNETAKGHREIAFSEYTGEAGFTISFSSGFLLDALKRIDSPSVQLNFVESMRPFTIEGVGTEINQVQLILPVRTY